jgi:hypothetical protein
VKMSFMIDPLTLRVVGLGLTQESFLDEQLLEALALVLTCPERSEILMKSSSVHAKFHVGMSEEEEEGVE